MKRPYRRQVPSLLWTLLAATALSGLPSAGGQSRVNSVIVPVPQREMAARHQEKVQAARSGKYDLLLIGTNNSDDANYPVVHTPEQIAEGTQAIVELLRSKLPQTQVLLLRIFPRSNVYKNGNAERGSARQRTLTNRRASDLVARLADGKRVSYLDVNHVFLRLDGSIDPELMPDLLHPSPKGALAWARAMEPDLAELMGDKSRDGGSQFLGPGGELPRELMSDFCHPTEKG